MKCAYQRCLPRGAGADAGVGCLACQGVAAHLRAPQAKVHERLGLQPSRAGEAIWWVDRTRLQQRIRDRLIVSLLRGFL